MAHSPINAAPNTALDASEPQPGTEHDAVVDETLVDETLVDDISIDGMCGVY